MVDLKALGAYIHNKREALGLSPSELANKAEIGRTTLWILERGENPKTGKPSRPTKDLLERLGFVLCLEPAEIDAMLELAGYTVRRPASSYPFQQATPLRPEAFLPAIGAMAGGQQDQSAIIEAVAEVLAEYRQQLIEDIREEFKQTIREMMGERSLHFPRFYPSVTSDRFWYIIGENQAHNSFLRELSQCPSSLVGSHFFEMHFWPPVQRAMNASGQWLPRAIRTVAGFQGMLADYLREAPQRRHEYDALVDRLSVLLPDFAHVYASARQVAPVLPERTTAPQHISVNHFSLPLRPSGSVDLVFDSMLTLPRGDYSEQTLTLAPASEETRIVLILLALAYTPLLAEREDDLLRQALWWLSAIKTVEEGLLHAGPDRLWEPQEAFNRIRNEWERAATSANRLTVGAALADLQETITHLAVSRELERRLLVRLLLHFTGNPAALHHTLAEAGKSVQAGE